MELTLQETQLVYEALRVVNAALGQHKIDLIRQCLSTSAESQTAAAPEVTDLDKAFDVQEALCNLLHRLEKEIKPTAQKKKRKPPKDGKNERRS